MRMRKTHIPYPAHQRGATLIVAMVILLILTLLGLQGLNNVTLQERMASSTQDALRAFAAAESGLAAAMRDAAANPSAPVANQSGVFAIAPPPTEEGLAQRVTGANYLLVPRGETAPPAGSGYAEGSATAFHFERISTGFGEAVPPAGAGDDFQGIQQGAVARLHGGVYQIGGLGGAASGSFTETTPGFIDDGT
jgi:type II secretory pathway pseudopilin PulG